MDSVKGIDLNELKIKTCKRSRFERQFAAAGRAGCSGIAVN